MEPLPGDGLIFEDPRFVNEHYSNYNYLSTSPCIDAGDPTEIDEDETRIDIGALHFPQGYFAIGDCNNDNLLNVVDVITIVNNCILSFPENPLECDCSDVNNDGNINVIDVIALVGIILENKHPLIITQI